MTNWMLRPYRPGDDPALAALFTNTVHRIGPQAYTAAELEAWAPSDYNPDDWNGRFAATWTRLAHDPAGTLVGFIELNEIDQTTGDVDMLFVSADHQRRGIARSLYEALETEARGRNYKNLIATASLIARPFFEAQGFSVRRQRKAGRGDQGLTVFDVGKEL